MSRDAQRGGRRKGQGTNSFARLPGAGAATPSSRPAGKRNANERQRQGDNDRATMHGHRHNPCGLPRPLARCRRGPYGTAVAPAWPLPPLPLPPLPSPPARPPLRRAKCRLDARGLACDARMRERPRDCCSGGRTGSTHGSTPSSIHARAGGGGERGTSRKTWYGTAGMGTGNKISAYRGSKTPGGSRDTRVDGTDTQMETD